MIVVVVVAVVSSLSLASNVWLGVELRRANKQLHTQAAEIAELRGEVRGLRAGMVATSTTEGPA